MISVTCGRLAFVDRALHQVLPSTHSQGHAAHDNKVHKCWHVQVQSKEKDPTPQPIRDINRWHIACEPITSQAPHASLRLPRI